MIRRNSKCNIFYSFLNLNNKTSHKNLFLGGAVNRDFTDLTERFESMAYFSLKIISMVKNYTRDAKHSSSLTLQCIPHTMTIPIQFTTHQTAI
jgi:hypothetical protein